MSVRRSPCSTSRRATLKMASGMRLSTITDECCDFDVPMRRKKAFPDPRSFSQNPYFCPAIIPETLSVFFCSTLYICLLYKNSVGPPPRGTSYRICFLSAHFFPFHSLQIVCRYIKFLSGTKHASFKRLRL
jgi:hypothetical protein